MWQRIKRVMVSKCVVKPAWSGLPQNQVFTKHSFEGPLIWHGSVDSAKHGEADRRTLTTCRHIDITRGWRQIVVMKRLQIQLPDKVYDRARKLCESREISLAEMARRGIEYILSVYNAASEDGHSWQPPKPRRLGWTGLSDAEIKQEAQLTTAETRVVRKTGK